MINNTHAQHQNEIGLISDNDAYVSLYLDEFYTNGLELFYKTAKNSKLSLIDKQISYFSIKQNIYNPQDREVTNTYIQERPYAGYLSINFLKYFINKKNIFSVGATYEITGSKTKAEEAQNFIHLFYNIDPIQGWKTQVKEKQGFGIFTNYTHNISNNSNGSPLSISWVNKTTFSSLMSNITSGISFRINLLESSLNPISNSSFFGTALQTKNEKWFKETYIGVKSLATYQIKDYTITGKLEENPSRKEFHLEPWTWLNDIGFYWNLEKANFSYHIIYKTREATEMKTKITRYGTIQFSYKF